MSGSDVGRGCRDDPSRTAVKIRTGAGNTAPVRHRLRPPHAREFRAGQSVSHLPDAPCSLLLFPPHPTFSSPLSSSPWISTARPHRLYATYLSLPVALPCPRHLLPADLKPPLDETDNSQTRSTSRMATTKRSRIMAHRHRDGEVDRETKSM